MTQRKSERVTEHLAAIFCSALSYHVWANPGEGAGCGFMLLKSTNIFPFRSSNPSWYLNGHPDWSTPFEPLKNALDVEIFGSD